MRRGSGRTDDTSARAGAASSGARGGRQQPPATGAPPDIRGRSLGSGELFVCSGAFADAGNDDDDDDVCDACASDVDDETLS